MSVYTCMAARRSGSGASSREDHSAAEARWRGARLVVGDVFRCLSWLSNSASSQRERPIRQFYGSPSTFLWDDDFGEVHHVHQGEGGEQGDPLMRCCSALVISGRWLPCSQSCLMRNYLHSWTTCTSSADHPECKRCSSCWKLSSEAAQASASIWAKPNCGMPVAPTGVASLSAAARMHDPQAVWRGDQGLPTAEQGFKVLGAPVGHPDFIRRFSCPRKGWSTTICSR